MELKENSKPNGKFINLGPARDLILTILREEGPLTDDALARKFLYRSELLGIKTSLTSIRRRRDELFKMGKVARAEGDDSYVKMPSGRWAAAWKAVE